MGWKNEYIQLKNVLFIFFIYLFFNPPKSHAPIFLKLFYSGKFNNFGWGCHKEVFPRNLTLMLTLILTLTLALTITLLLSYPNGNEMKGYALWVMHVDFYKYLTSEVRQSRFYPKIQGVIHRCRYLALNISLFFPFPSNERKSSFSNNLYSP